MATIKTNYFYGYEVSEYGKRNGYVDYRTLSRAFDSVLCNDITKLFYAEVNGEYNEPEQANGLIDNSETIEEYQNEIDELLTEYRETEDPDRERTILNTVEKYESLIEELKEEENPREIYQYYIISNTGAEILKQWTDEIVYYIPALDVYVWGVTHWGTSWDYVLTNIKIEASEEE